MSNSKDVAAELLQDGLRYEKAGLPNKALELYREARRDLGDPALLAQSWRLEAYAHHGLCAWDEALAAARRSGEIARAAGLDDLAAEALNAEGAVHLGRGALDQAVPVFEAMLELSQDPRIRGLALQNLGIALAERRQLEEAAGYLEEAYREFQRADYAWGKAHVLNNTVALAIERLDFRAAEEMGRRAIQVARAVDDLDLLAIATLNLAEALAGLGQLEAAEEKASTALGHFEISGNRWRRVACLRALGDMSADRGDTETARMFWERGLALAREIGADKNAAELEVRLAGQAPSNASGQAF